MVCKGLDGFGKLMQLGANIAMIGIVVEVDGWYKS